MPPGDRFLGVPVPEIRKMVRESDALPIANVTSLVSSPLHEERLLGFLILVRRFERGEGPSQRQIYRTYLRQTRFLNGWDLVDVSAPNIVGTWLLSSPGDRSILAKLAGSTSLWERRIAIVSTLTFIRAGVFDPTLAIAKTLLHDPEDLIHKATGWMLRELGKRNPDLLRKYLRQHAGAMPRTMLRYAIEKFSTDERRHWRDPRSLG
jgi:3-methyladenine DNA glycosylase AlkD